MDYKATPQMHQAAHALVEEVMRTGFFLIDVLSGLVEDLEDNDGLGREDPAEVVLQMVAGSFIPACNSAGPASVRSATALVGALADRTLADLRTAARLAGSDAD